MNRNPIVNFLQNLNIKGNSNLLVAVLFVTIVLMIIVPLPGFLLDVLLAVNIALSIIILLTSVYSHDPLEFSVFPTLLLMTTIFGLALNISSTRLILLQGPAFSVQIIRAFGDFVIQGNYVVGFIIFLIILAVQFIVITRGAQRISEVAARFKLEEFPNKNMSIEAEFTSGSITGEEKKTRQAKILQESEFYGSMDGAARFIQGNVIVSLIITAINLLGGIIIGVAMRGESFGESLKLYGLFTVGDGLVSQIPALLISTATGIIITRSSVKTDFAGDIVRQLSSQPRAMLIAAILLAALLFVPGFPKIPLFFLSAILGSIGWVQLSNTRLKKEKDKKQAAEKEILDKGRTMKPDDLLHVDPLEVEIGYSLIPLADQESGGDLLDRIAMIRRNMAIELGLVIPPIRIRDNVKFEPSAYAVLIKGVEMGRGTVRMGHYLAMDLGGVTEKIKADPTKDPVFGLPAVWVTESQRQKAELGGYNVVDPSTIITTHLTEIIKSYGYELLGRQEVQQLLDNVQKTHPVLVQEVRTAAKLGEVQKVLQKLLMERVSIRDMVTILETISDYGQVKNIDLLTEYVRQALKRQITSLYRDTGNSISVIAMDPEIEELLSNSIQEADGGFQLTLDPKVMRAIISKTVTLAEAARATGIVPIVLVSSRVRGVFHSMVQTSMPSLVVLSYNEIDPGVQVKTVDVIAFRS